ncbi:MAG: translation elongation factor-like protein [Dehalococcoidia bacterium]|nr:translation elongation factor-like protein [Dehalococcoidia bacterium]MDZ4247006.1 translation elongation factor-like protein [Dehalococcoidia bacterium]
MPEELVGEVVDFFAKPVVAAVHATSAFKVGDTIHFKGHTTDLQVTVNSMQINNKSVTEANAGDDVGVKVPDKVRHGDSVYRVV